MKNTLDLFYFTANRVDRMADDGNTSEYDMMDYVSRGVFGVSLPRCTNILDAFVEVLAADIRRKRE